MMAVVGFMVFAAALLASLAVFALTLIPALPRIVSLLRDGVDPSFVPARISFLNEARLRARVATTLPTTLPTASRPAWREAA